MLENIEKKIEDYKDEIKFRTKQITVKEKKKNLSEKAHSVKELLDKTITGNFIYELCSLLMGERIERKTKTKPHTEHTMIVIKSDETKGYPKNQPILVSNNGYGLTMNGNVFSTTLPDDVRTATEDEITGYFKNFDYSKGLQNLLKLINEV